MVEIGAEKVTYPDKENTMSLLGDWLMHYTAVKKMMDGIQASMGMDHTGQMFVTVWAVFGAYTDTLAVEIGDFHGWLDWYRFETDMGKRSKTVVSLTGRTKKIKTLGQLAALIIEARGWGK